jgi:hypothetical protein
MNTIEINGAKWSASTDSFGPRVDSEGWGFRLTVATMVSDESPWEWSITDLATGDEVAHGSTKTVRMGAKAAVEAARTNARGSDPQRLAAQYLESYAAWKAIEDDAPDQDEDPEGWWKWNDKAAPILNNYVALGQAFARMVASDSTHPANLLPLARDLVWEAK